MKKEFYESHENKRIEEYKHIDAEDYRANKEEGSPKIEIKPILEENEDNYNKTRKKDDSSLKRLLKGIGSSSTSLVTTTAIMASVGAAIVVAPELFINSKDTNVVPLAPPTIELSQFDVGNDYLLYDILLTDLKTDYKIEITNASNNEEIYSSSLFEGNNKKFIENLLPDNTYNLEILSESEQNGNQVYLNESFTTKDGSKPMFIYDISPYVTEHYTTSIEYDIYISDPLQKYDNYLATIIEEHNEIFDEQMNINKHIKKKIDWLRPGKLTFEIYGQNIDSERVLVDTYQYDLVSIVEKPTHFIGEYVHPKLTDISYEFQNDNIWVTIPFIYKKIVIFIWD